MPTIKDNAQVLSVIETSNTSLVVVLLAEHAGQIHVHAKGARRWPKKGFEGGMDLLTRGEIVVYPRPDGMLWLLKEWSETARPRLGQTVPMLYAASFLSELTLALTRATSGQVPEGAVSQSNGTDRTNGEVPATVKLFRLLATASDALASGASAGGVILTFTLLALEVEGLLPDFNACDECNKSLARESVPAWLSADGLRCIPCIQRLARNAPPGVKLSPEALRSLQHIRATGLPVKLSPTAAEQLARTVIVLIHGALERDLHTLPAAVRLIRGNGRGQGTGANGRGQGSGVRGQNGNAASPSHI